MKNINNKISIITLVRNNKHFLKESIGSLLNQTDTNWESIIINDGSSQEIIYDDFLNDDEKIKYKEKIKIINNKDWLGIIKCHKLGVFYAKNEIIGILDADDKLDNTTIEKVLNKYNNDIDDNIFVYTNFYYCDDNLNILENGYSRKIIDTCLLNERCGNHFRTFKKKYYLLTKGYDDDLIFGAEDQDILFKMEEFCKPVFLDECLYYYRTNNSTGSISCLKRASSYSLHLSILKNIINRFGDLKFTLEIYSKKEDNEYLNKYWKYELDKDYHFELKANGIFIKEIVNNIQYYSQIYESSKINKFDVNVKWDYKLNTLILSNVKFSIENFRKIHINTYFDNIYIISLTTAKNNRNRINKILSNYNIYYEIFDAVNGYELQNTSGFKKSILKSPGAYGYLLTMIKIFEDAKKNKYNKILICDDDIILKNNFVDEFDKNIKKIPYDWKVLFLGFSGPWVYHKTFRETFDYKNNYITNLYSCEGSFCSGYDRSLFDKIIELCNLLNLPFDTQLNLYLIDNPSIIKYAIFPHIVTADTLHTSSIVQYEEENNVIQNFKRNHLKFCVNIDEFDCDSMLNNKYNHLKISK